MIGRMESWLEQERERLPLWIPVGVGTGIAIWELFWGDALWWVVGAGAAMAASALLFSAGSYLRTIFLVLPLAVIAGFGLISLKSAVVADAALERPWYGEFYGRVEQAEHLAAREKYRLTLDTDGHAGLPQTIRVNLSPEQYRPEFRAGAVVRLKARLMPPAGPALPGGYDFARRAWFAGLGATGSALGEVQLHSASQRPYMLQDFRQSLSSHVRSRLSPSEGSIAAALATGDTGAISPEDAKAMRESGMAHLLSISGLHVTAIVGGVFLFVSRLLALVPWFALRYSVPLISAGIAALAALGYTLLTGAEVPTIRSCVAALLILLALAMGREVLSLRMVAAGALFVMLFWPETIAGPSFQLSFAAVTTIIVLHEHRFMRGLISGQGDGVAKRIGRGAVSLLLTGLAIEIVLAPIALFHFHKTGLYGALANMAAIPLTTFVIMPFEFLALLFDMVGLGAPFWWVVEQGLHLILAIAHGVSALPGAVTMRPEMPIFAFAALVLGGLWFAIFTQRIRFAGLVPVAVGFLMLVTTARPDILITRDGKHMAIVADDEQGQGANIALLRSRAGEYVRDTLRETAGITAQPSAIEDYTGARCSADSCVIEIAGKNRNWRVLATRTPYFIPAMELAAACRRVDIVVSDRRLPYSCKPSWMRLDRRSLAELGGVSVYLNEGRVDSVNAKGARPPWRPAVTSATRQKPSSATTSAKKREASIQR